MQTIDIKLTDIKPYEKNAKKYPESQVRNVAESIKEFGWAQPIVVDENNVIIIGHGRLRAAYMLNLETAPCLVLKGLTEAEKNKLRLLDNKLNESEWDYDLLKEQLPELDFSNFPDLDWGIITPEEEKEVIEDEPPEVDEENEPIAKLGDIYLLGEHRLMCGDSTKAEDVQRLMGGSTADLVVTDPPYNVNYGSINETGYGKKRGNATKILNDNMDDLSFYNFLYEFYQRMNDSLKPGGAFYIFHADSEGLNFRKALKDAGMLVRETLIWVKSGLVLGRQDYQWKHEPCLYGWKDGAAHYFIDDRAQTTVYEDKGIDLKKLKKEEMLKLLQDIFSDKTSTTVIHEEKTLKNDLHPTMKPIRLLARLIRNSSKQGELVFDGFGGSGSTLIACEQTNRKCYMMEYDPKYVDVIVKRWENLTGKTAIKVDK